MIVSDGYSAEYYPQGDDGMKWWVDENIRETPTEVQQSAFICTNCGGAFGGTGLAHIMEKFVYCPYCGKKLSNEKTEVEE